MSAPRDLQLYGNHGDVVCLRGVPAERSQSAKNRFFEVIYGLFDVLQETGLQALFPELFSRFVTCLCKTIGVEQQYITGIPWAPPDISGKSPAEMGRGQREHM